MYSDKMSVSSIQSCEPCKYRCITSSAVKYCQSCQEQLCKECVDFHKSFKMTRGHLLVDTEDQQSLKLCLDVANIRMCKQHFNKPTEFYCWCHDTLMCSLCLLKSEHHRNCKNQIVEIENVGKSLIDSEFTDTTKREFRNVISCANHAVKEMKEVKDASKMTVDTIRDDIEVIRSKLLKTFDRQAQSIVQKAIEVNRDIDDKYAETIEKLEKEIKKAEDNEKILITVLESRTPDETFRCLMSILEQIEEFKIEIDKLSGDDIKQEIVMLKSDVLKQLERTDKPLVYFHIKETTVKHHTTARKENTKSYLKKQMIAICAAEREQAVSINGQEKHLDANKERQGTKTVIGKITIENEQCEKQLMFNTLGNASDDLDSAIRNDEERVHIAKQTKDHREKAENYEIELSHGSSFSVLALDSKVPWFGGIVCLPNDRLVLSDLNNSRLILLNDDNQVLTTKTLTYEPGYITLLNPTCLAVCLMKRDQILLTEIKTTTIQETMYVQTEYRPKCVQPVKDKMLVSCQDINGGWHLVVITIQGEVCQQIKPNGLFDGQKIAVQTLNSGIDNFRIIQYCERTDRLQCFEFDGSCVFDYGVDRVASVVTDSNGYIFIIRYTGEIQVLSPDGDFLCKLYLQTLYKAKIAAFNQEMNKLFITIYKNPKIHVLNVKRTARRNRQLTGQRPVQSGMRAPDRQISTNHNIIFATPNRYQPLFTETERATQKRKERSPLENNITQKRQNTYEEIMFKPSELVENDELI